MQMPNIPGVVMSQNTPSEPPMLLLLGTEKSGKSACTISLIGYQGKYPLVMAIDKTGADTCTNLGYPVPIIRPCDEPGMYMRDKVISAITKLDAACKGREKPFNALVIDCCSTLVDRLMTDAMDEFCLTHQGRRPKDKRQIYGTVLDQGREIINRIQMIGLPTVWLTWLQPPYLEENEDPGGNKFKKTVLGGPMIDGQKLRALLSGKAHQILILEKIKCPANDPLIQGDGFKRVFHTKTWEHIEAGGRYSSKLPEPCPPNLAWIMQQITGK